jgi:hypothetical protein
MFEVQCQKRDREGKEKKEGGDEINKYIKNIKKDSIREVKENLVAVEIYWDVMKGEARSEKREGVDVDVDGL